MTTIGETVSKDLHAQIEDFFKTQPGTKLERLRDRQAEIGYSFMPYDGLCPYCSYDFVEDPRSWNQVITGCRNASCARSYCE